jgi:RNA polymerase sigma-70 factor (ECF subfamily)
LEGEEQKFPAPEPPQEDVEERAASVRRALEELPPNQREAILLHKYEGMPLQEVATALGCSVGAAKLRAFRGYEALRRILLGGDP